MTGKAPTTELTLVSKQFKHSSDLRTIGVDEAGRGPLVGSVVAAAVILPPDFHLYGLTDSKKLSEKKRDSLYQQITDQCDWSVAEASSIEIDQINILQATMLAMKRAIIDLQEEYSKYRGKTIFNVMVDGNHCPDIANCIAIVKGDLRSANERVGFTISAIRFCSTQRLWHPETHPSFVKIRAYSRYSPTHF